MLETVQNARKDRLRKIIRLSRKREWLSRGDKVCPRPLSLNSLEGIREWRNERLFWKYMPES